MRVVQLEDGVFAEFGEDYESAIERGAYLADRLYAEDRAALLAEAPAWRRSPFPARRDARQASPQGVLITLSAAAMRDPYEHPFRLQGGRAG